jgi:chemotaxis regulatin CheY-phosphate phosphatase CheZ
MTARQASELLYDSEAALRLVDSAIEEIREPEGRRAAESNTRGSELRDALAAANGPLGLLGLSQVLARSYTEIVSVLGSLRESRNTLERSTVERIQATHAKLREVSNATEVAATDILNGLERSLALVDQMDQKATEGDARSESDLRQTLRDELFALMGCMQFQDITAQQLNYASSVLTEMEDRLAELARVLDPATFGTLRLPRNTPVKPNGPVTFDPAASTENAEARQAAADEIFSRDKKA